MNRNGVRIHRHAVPFSFTVKLPPTQIRGVDYGFESLKKSLLNRR